MAKDNKDSAKKPNNPETKKPEPKLTISEGTSKGKPRNVLTNPKKVWKNTAGSTVEER